MTDLINRLPIGLIFGVFMAYLAWDYYEFMNSETSDLHARKAQVQTAQNTLDATKKKLEAAKESERRLESARADARNVAQQLEQVGSGLSQEFDIPGTIKLVATEAAKTGLRVGSIRPTEQKKEELYTEQAFEVSYTGAFVQLVMFLERVSNTEKIIRVDAVEVRRNGPATSKVVELTGTLEVKTYKYKSKTGGAT